MPAPGGGPSSCVTGDRPSERPLEPVVTGAERGWAWVDHDLPWHDPDLTSNKALARAALEALAVMTQEAASRPDPRKELGARARRWTEQLRDR